MDTSGRFVYVANAGDATVSQYSIGTDGTLSPLSPAVVASEGKPASILVDPTGRYVYVANTSGVSVSQYVIGENGNLTANAPSRVSAQQEPSALSEVTGCKYVEALGRFAYVLNGDRTLSLFGIGNAGELTGAGNMPLTGCDPSFIAIDPSNRALVRRMT